jgi:murein DD-endopeptidase MepM/ murein hydrolase activator NlpD
MTRRSRLAACLVALVAVGWLVVGGEPRSTALASDPILDAKAKQAALQSQLAAQKAQLAALRLDAARLSSALDYAKVQLASVSAQYEKVANVLTQVKQEVADVQGQLAALNHQILTLDAQLKQIAADIVTQTKELAGREALLQDHLRSAYEQSQTSLLEVLLSSKTLDDATNQVGYLLTVSDGDKSLADDITQLRSSLKIKQKNLTDGRAALKDARAQAQIQEQQLVAKRAELSALQTQLAALKRAWEAQKARQEAALNASLKAQKNLKAQIGKIEAAAAAQAALVKKLQAQQLAASQIGPGGLRWPETGYHITQFFGPTTFALEPPLYYQGHYYAHFHTGLDMAVGCGTPIYASGNGTVAASGQPLAPYDSGFGVILNHGGGLQTWYWHLQPRVVVFPGQHVTGGQLIGYEGSTGFATGCHLHFAVNLNDVWRNPLAYLP